MKKCADMGKIPVSIGIDTWGVDFVLTDKAGKIIGDSVSYRDKRTDNVSVDISDKELYSRTGNEKNGICRSFRGDCIRKYCRTAVISRRI